MTLWYSLKSGEGILSAWFLLLRIILENPGLWCDHMNFRLPFLLLWRIIWNFSGCHIETIGQFESITVFTVIILPTHKYKRPLHHLMYYSKSLFGGLNFLVQKSFTCLVRFIPAWLFKLLWVGLSSWFLSRLVHCLSREKTHFVSWFYILITCLKHLLILRDFWCHL